MREKQTERAVTLGAGLACFAAGVALGQFVLNENQARPEDIAVAHSERNGLLAGFDALTTERSCQEQVLQTLLVTGFSGGSDEVAASLESVCGESVRPELATKAADYLASIDQVSQHISDLEGSMETGAPQRVVAGVLGGVVVFGAAWGIYTSALRG